MSNLREIKNRVKSTHSTAKVTRAMEMVSAVKSKLAAQESMAINEFANKVKEVMVKVGGVEKNKKNSLSKKIGMIVIGSSRGFVGQLNNQLMGAVLQFIAANPKVIVEGIGVQKYGMKVISQCNLTAGYDFENKITANETDADLWSILAIVEDKYNQGIYQEVYVAYNHFYSLLKSVAVVDKLLPIDDQELGGHKIDDSYVYEPNREEVTLQLQQKLVEAKLLRAIINSQASEHSARMMTMKNATDNAIEMIDTLTQNLNKERQNRVTQQIIEVVAGGKKYEK